MKKTQKEKVLDYLIINKTITSLECVYKLNIVDLQHAIMELRKDGINITDEWIDNGNTRFKRYKLDATNDI